MKRWERGQEAVTGFGTSPAQLNISDVYSRSREPVSLGLATRQQTVHFFRRFLDLWPAFLYLRPIIVQLNYCQLGCQKSLRMILFMTLYGHLPRPAATQSAARSISRIVLNGFVVFVRSANILFFGFFALMKFGVSSFVTFCAIIVHGPSGWFDPSSLYLTSFGFVHPNGLKWWFQLNRLFFIIIIFLCRLRLPVFGGQLQEKPDKYLLFSHFGKYSTAINCFCRFDLRGLIARLALHFTHTYSLDCNISYVRIYFNLFL